MFEALAEFVTVHWFYAVPMGLMSCVGVALVIWRLLLNMNGKTSMNEFLPAFQQMLEVEGVQGALRYCKARTDIIPSKLFVAGLENAPQGMSAVRRAMANSIELEILPDLNFLLPSILAIAKVATMIGLLVTVISMIGSFKALGSKDGAKGQGKEISLALFGTAMGLVTAIPLVFAHVQFKAWVADFEVKMKSSALKLVLLIQAKQAGKSVAPPPTGPPPGKGGAPTGTTAVPAKAGADSAAISAKR